jgi:bifunctional non-homologous end joining protein LigD
MTHDRLPISHPDKVLFPTAKLTKLDLAHHYERVAPVMLPYLAGRPLALEAHPGGIESKGFFMKAVPDYFPAFVERATVDKRDGTITHALAENADTLVYLAGQNVVTIHQWLSRADEPRRPDRLIIDLDPSGRNFSEVRAAAREAGDRLRDAGLVPYAMVTGSRGVHVICPLRRDHDFTEVHRYTRALAEAMVADDPKKLTLEWHVAERGSKIYLDVNRIAYAQHAVSPYSPRARDRAPVAAPIHWEELSDPKLRPDRFTVKNIGARVDSEGDPWKGMGRRARKLPA